MKSNKGEESTSTFTHIPDETSLLESIVENSPDIIWAKSLDGKYLLINRAFEKFFKKKKAEVIGKNDVQVFGKKLAKYYQISDLKVLETDKTQTVYDKTSIDDKVQTMMTIKCPLQDKEGKTIGVFGLSRNFTEHEQVKQLLQSQNALLSMIFEHAPDPIFVKDLSGVYKQINQAFANFHGKSIEDLAGKTDHDLFDEEIAEAFIKDDQHVVKTGETSESESTVLVNNTRKISLTTKAPLIADDGSIIGVIGIGRDITYSKQIESKLIEAQKMDSIANLAGGIAHDLNNILSGVLGYASILLEEESDNEKINSLSNIINSAERAAELIRRLQLFTKKQKGRLLPVNLNDIVTEINDLVTPSLNQLIQINIDTDTTIPSVDGDSTQLAQLVMNLVVNAVEAIPNQGTIVITTDSVKVVNFDRFLVKPKNRKTGLYNRITVRDDGIGINKAQLNKIFEPFYTTKTDGEVKGMGLGMSIVYAIVNNHEGLIDIKSKVNQGTIVQVYFPHGKIKKKKKKKETESMDRGSGYVMIVDDDETIRNLLSLVLEKLGYYYLIAVDGEDAIKKFQENYEDLDCVILDMIMPKMDGKKTYQQMKLIDPDVKVILSSGHAKSSGPQELLDMGVVDLLEKPYTISDVSEKLKNVIGSKN